MKPKCHKEVKDGCCAWERVCEECGYVEAWYDERARMRKGEKDGKGMVSVYGDVCGDIDRYTNK